MCSDGLARGAGDIANQFSAGEVTSDKARDMQAKMWDLFQKVDKDKSGLLDKQEIRSLVRIAKRTIASRRFFPYI